MHMSTTNNRVLLALSNFEYAFLLLTEECIIQTIMNCKVLDLYLFLAGLGKIKSLNLIVLRSLSATIMFSDKGSFVPDEGCSAE